MPSSNSKLLNTYVEVQGYKHDGRMHRIWDSPFCVEDNEDYIVLVSYKTKVIEHDFRVWYTKESAVMIFFKHEWKNRYIITYVTYRFSKKFEPKLDYGNIKSFLSSNGIDNPTARCLRDAIISIRNAKLPDPGILGNAGSFFVNPIISMEKYSALSAEYQNMPHYLLDDGRVKVPAGWLIEQCGWKGRSLGNAGVYEKQSLVLVNRGGATGEEILALCERICSDVNKRFGIEIFPEVCTFLSDFYKFFWDLWIFFSGIYPSASSHKKRRGKELSCKKLPASASLRP